MNFGTDEQKDFFLPKILAGEIHFCIGYTEPGRRHRPGLAADHGRCATATSTSSTGQKIFTSLAGDADYIWLATRTNPEVAKHKGISMFIVPDGHPGHPGRARCSCWATTTSTTRSTRTCGSRPPAWSAARTTGWTLITNQLNHERVTLCSPGHHRAGPGRGPGLGPGHQAGRRPAGHRPGVGAGQPGPGPRQARVPQADQLEGGVDGDPGPPRRGRRVDASRSSAPSSTCEAFRLLFEVVGPAPAT